MAQYKLVASPSQMAAKANPIPTKIGGSSFVIAPIATPYDAQLANAKATLYSPTQQRTIANQQVGAQINAALGASNASSTAEQKQFTDLANRAAGLAAALGSFGQDYG